MNSDALSREAIGSAIRVHSKLGPGLLESAYQECLMLELSKRDPDVQKEVPVPVVHEEI